MPPSRISQLLIPIAIVLAGLVLAVAIYVVRVRHAVLHGTGDPEAVAPITPTDHLMGNPSAPVAIIEYADSDSVYSKSFEKTMEQLMTEYAAGDKVVWVYRHFPLTTDHPNAATNALAAECVTSLSTPPTFFQFIDAMQAAAPDENEFDPNDYPVLIAQFGIPTAAFRDCMTKATFEERIHDNYANALASGATGSPFVILLVQGQKPVPINGAVPYSTLKKLIEQSIAKTTK